RVPSQRRSAPTRLEERMTRRAQRRQLGAGRLECQHGHRAVGRRSTCVRRRPSLLFGARSLDEPLTTFGRYAPLNPRSEVLSVLMGRGRRPRCEGVLAFVVCTSALILSANG